MSTCHCIGFFNPNCCMRRQWDNVRYTGFNEVVIKQGDIDRGELEFLRKELVLTNAKLEALDKNFQIHCVQAYANYEKIEKDLKRAFENISKLEVEINKIR